jgi:tetratricopeptide (TPR) repeat protein
MASHQRFDLPGRDRDLAWLLAQQRKTASEGKGQIVFVVGDEGSGRRPLLHALTAELGRARHGPAVVAGAFEEGGYVPWDDPSGSTRAAGTLKQAFSVGESIASLAQPALPIAGFLGQILSKSKAALELATSLTEAPDRPDPSASAPRVLARLCEDGPVACVIDDADSAESGWWADLVLMFGRRVARNLPLLLVLGVDGPTQLGDHEDAESDTLFVARALGEEGLASWHPLSPVTTDDLRRWAGGTMVDIAGRLLDVTAGGASWCAALWREWVRRDLVEQSRDGTWRFTAAGRDESLDEVEDLLGDRLKRLLGPTDLNTLERTRRLLACAALEGRRFTADAVALALQRSSDEVIDLLDESLVVDDEHPWGVVTEVESVAVSDESGARVLWLYEFAAELDWLTLRHHGFAAGEQRRHSLLLARALQALYGGEARRAAPSLARLFEAAGEREPAAHFRRMRDVGTNRAVILSRVLMVLKAPDPQGRAERRRASQILLAGAHELVRSGPFDQGFTLSQRAHRLAPLRTDQARALYLMGRHSLYRGESGYAREQLAAARELFRALRNRSGEAASIDALAYVDFVHGDYTNARRGYMTALEMYRAIRDRRSEANALLSLANIDYERGDYESARDGYLTSLAIHHELGNRAGEIDVRSAIADVDFQQADYDEARAGLLTVLELYREFDDRRGEAYARHTLANVDYARDDYDKARAGYLAASAIYRMLDHVRSEARSRHALGMVESALSNYETARAEFLAVLQLYREVGNRKGEAEALASVAHVDQRRGNYGEARDGYLAALAMHRELESRDGTAEVSRKLAGIELRLGDYEEARANAAATLDTAREIGARRGEAISLELLADVDYERGDYDRARDGYLAALAIYREIGYRDMETATRLLLAQIDLRLGFLDRARAGTDAALEGSQRLGTRLSEARAHLQLGEIGLAEGDYDQAFEESATARDLFAALGDRHGHGKALLAIAEIGYHRGLHDQARADAEAALEVFQGLGTRHSEARAHLRLGEIGLAEGDYDSAEAECSAAGQLFSQVGDPIGSQAAAALLDRVAAAQAGADTRSW